MTLVHVSSYKITSISFLISIASHISVACFYLLLKKKKCRPLPFGILATLSFLLANFSDRLLRVTTSCFLRLQAGE